MVPGRKFSITTSTSLTRRLKISLARSFACPKILNQCSQPGHFRFHGSRELLRRTADDFQAGMEKFLSNIGLMKDLYSRLVQKLMIAMGVLAGANKPCIDVDS